MKRILAIFAALLFITAANAQIAVAPYVDERTELLSIVFRLAEASEYVTDDLKDYMADIDTYFVTYKNHDVVKYAQDVRSKYGIGYDAVMSMATHIEIVAGEVKIKDNIQQGSLDNRWADDNVAKFVVLLNQFYKESKFHLFFEQHQNLYKTAENSFSKILKSIDFGWFEKFYGEKNTDNFNLIISLVNGGNNYGSTVLYINNTKDIYAIIGIWNINELEESEEEEEDFRELIVHEFNHSFCNPYINEFYSQLEEQATDFFSRVEEKMTNQAYGSPHTMLYEILVRACVIKYKESIGTDSDYIKYSISEEISNGFFWMKELVNSLSVYEKNRIKYPTLKSYMPEIVKLQNSISPDEIFNQIEKNKPVILGTNIENCATNIDPAITEITVKFDKPMRSRPCGLSYGKKGKGYMPKSLGADWLSDTEWVISVALEPDTEYSISFPDKFFCSKEILTLKETYYLDFKTGDRKEENK